ncbi:hypothetical protein KEM54_000973 [Ascosphaera aggregata]|nr:hypothetical protein KEM54_000973 [Ascosphaera aggregata]
MAASWLQIAKESPFSLANIPFGIISTLQVQSPRPAIAVGSHALDLLAFSMNNGFSKLPDIQPYLLVFQQPTLNDFAELGRPFHRKVRSYLQDVFKQDTPYPQLLKDNEEVKAQALIPLKDVKNHLPMTIRDYTDFYVGMNHAYNCGCLFRDPNNALQPNYMHLPVAYHGRASSVVVSGTPIRRPLGQSLKDPTATPKIPSFGPSAKLDMELELAAFVCKGNKLGEPIHLNEADDHLFGVVLMNDWSARDFQMWEIVPLGPFTAKNFGTSISPWVVLMDALEPFRCSGIGADNNVNLLPYLKEESTKTALDIRLSADLRVLGMNEMRQEEETITTLTMTSATNLLFSFQQMLAHHTIGGCNMRTGDLLGSGTISGTEPGTYGSLIENTNGGKEVIELADGNKRTFLQDGDEIVISGMCGEEGQYVGFGEKLQRSFFQCSQCIRNEALVGSTVSGTTRGMNSRRWMSIYRSSEQAVARQSTSRAAAVARRSPFATLKTSPFNHFKRLYSEAAGGAAASSSEAAGAKKTSFPDISDKKVGYWLLGSTASVFGIVVFGGLTRLTESGLSITEWRPVTGSLPPMSQEDWESEFAKYKDSPEYHILNPHMNLQEFRNIYYMEWIHRLWGRFIGLTVLIPAVYFVAKRKVSKPMAWKLGGIVGLLGFQGVIGWWMVASGLVDDLFAPGSHPRVSQYRLTTHLGAAFVLYTAMLTSGLGIIRAHNLFKVPKEGIKLLEKLGDSRLKVFRRSVAGLAVLTFITSMTGGLVAGLDAGLIYNDFPYMGSGLAPPKSELLDDHYSRKENKSDLWWRNCCENPSLVQLNHRIAALATFTAACALFAYSRTPRMKRLLPKPVAMGVHGVLGFAALQASLGIATLMLLVPIPLASLHQAGSLLLLTWTFVLGSRVWIPARTSRLLAKAVQGRPVRLSGVSPLSAHVKYVAAKNT